MSALAERMNGRRLAVVEQPRTLDAYGRLEALCDPGSLNVIRSTVLPRRESKRMAPGDGVVGGSGTVAGRPGVLLRAGPELRRRLAGRGARRDDHPRDGAGRARRGAGRGLHRLRRRAHGRRRRRAGRLRADLPPQRAAVRPRPADLRDQRRVGGRRLVLAGADRLRRDDRGVGDVPHRPGRRARGDGRGRRRRRARRPARALRQRRVPVRRRRRPRRGARWCATCSPTCPQRAGETPPIGPAGRACRRIDPSRRRAAPRRARCTTCAA